MSSSTITYSPEQNRRTSHDNEHFEAILLTDLEKYLGQETLKALLRKAVQIITASKEAHWIECPNTILVHEDFKTPFAKAEILLQVVQSCPNSDTGVLLDAASILANAILGYESGYTYAQLLQKGVARDCIVGIYLAKKNFDIGYLLALVNLHPCCEIIVKAINMGMKDPDLIAQFEGLISPHYPKECRPQMTFGHLLSYILGGINGKEYQDKIMLDCQNWAKKVVRGLKCHPSAHKCFTLTSSTT